MSDLVREAKQIKVKDASQVVVSQGTTLKDIPATYAARHADEDTQGERDNMHPSADQNLGSNLN
jgi:hypothetical protein